MPDSRKRKFAVDSLCQNCSFISIPGLDSLLTKSPYAKVLCTRVFVELTKPMCDLLNEDWEFRPQLRYACAQVLATAASVTRCDQVVACFSASPARHPDQASVGGTTLSFVLSTADASNATRIFLDQESVDAALVLAANKKAWAVSNRSLLYQLRQVKTMFHDPKWICSRDFFRMISKEVLQNGSSATLKLSTVQESLVRCAKHSQIATAFETILVLFPAGATSVPILGDQRLNKELEILANLLSSYIATANKSVVTFMQQNFSTNNA
ncbi:MAG: hypothetical protein JOS17DRAFT_796568 [Linnemannia elongata]|nr:MAG: hypothetical protein JOS17DRAFT_796568 [Linnemannia elongata]